LGGGWNHLRTNPNQIKLVVEVKKKSDFVFYQRKVINMGD
jgi:hypothetical protein